MTTATPTSTPYHWLLGRIEPDGFTYTAHRIVCTDGWGERWCARLAEAHVSACGIAVSPTAPEGVEVFTTCRACGEFLMSTGQALQVPSQVANDAASTYWRLRQCADLVEV